MFKLTIVSAVWRRPEIFDLFADGIDLLKNKFKGRIDITVSVAGSERSAKKMVEDRGFSYVNTPNHPLGQKMNKALLNSVKLQPDFIMWLGSDDIITPELMEHYYLEMEKGTDYTYLMDFYFYDTVTKKAFYWKGYRRTRMAGYSCGAGRMVSRRVLEIVKWRLWYNDKYHDLLDTSMDVLIKDIPMSKQKFYLRDLKCFAVDIKSAINMTNFVMWDNTLPRDGKKMLFDFLPKKLAEKIYST